MCGNTNDVGTLLRSDSESDPSRTVTGLARKLSRRELLARAAQTSLAFAVLPTEENGEPLRASEASSDRVIWDAHVHLSGVAGTVEERVDRLLGYADRMRIQRLFLSMGTSFVYDPAPDEVRRQNDEVLRAIAHAPERICGLVYLNPKYTEDSLREMDRCLRDGPMVGVKLWVAVKCHQSELDPIVRRAVALNAPLLQHTFFKAVETIPGESNPADLAALAARHPDASFISAHVGGDWERGIRTIRATPNVWAEICGSDPTAGMVEMAVRELGAERVLYGSDAGGRSFASQLAKVESATVPEDVKRLILSGNLRKLFRGTLSVKGIPA